MGDKAGGTREVPFNLTLPTILRTNPMATRIWITKGLEFFYWALRSKFFEALWSMHTDGKTFRSTGAWIATKVGGTHP